MVTSLHPSFQGPTLPSLALEVAFVFLPLIAQEELSQEDAVPGAHGRVEDYGSWGTTGETSLCVFWCDVQSEA